MTLSMWNPRKEALTLLALLLTLGHVVRLSRRGDTYTVAGGTYRTTFIPRTD